MRFIAWHMTIMSHPFGLSSCSSHILTPNAVTMLEAVFLLSLFSTEQEEFVVWCYCVCVCTWIVTHTHVHGCVHLSGVAQQALLFTHCPTPAFMQGGYWLMAVFKTFLFPTYWICAAFIYLLFHLCLFWFILPRVFLIGVSCSQLLCVKRLRT